MSNQTPQRRAETTIAQRTADRHDFNRMQFSEGAKRLPLDAMGADGERETSAGLSAAQRVMRKIRITLTGEMEFDADQVY